jgi:hypothetical protein
MGRKRPPDWLPGGFKVAAHRWYEDPDCPCWLAQFDHEHRACEGEVEAFHFFGRQEVRNALRLPAELVALAEWDPRNGGPACVVHHRRFDAHLTPTLKVPAPALPAHVLGFALDWGLEVVGERRFEGNFERVLAALDTGIVDLAREQSPRILGGQPSAL